MASKQSAAKESGSGAARMTNLLPVVQFELSHDLKFDPDDFVEATALVVAPPYQAMSVGDNALLKVVVMYEDIELDSFTVQNILNERDVGRPLQWLVERNKFTALNDLDAIFSYSITYAMPTVPTQSEKQVIQLVEPTSPLLTAPTIKDYDGDMLDPEAFPNGLLLNIPVYPDIEVGDHVMLYALGDSREIKSVQVDQSTIDSEILHITLDYEWLSANNGMDVSLMYQYARVGSAGTSTALSLTLREPLVLPHPIIEDVIRDGEDDKFQGYLLGERITGGIYAEIPEDAIIGGKDKVQMNFVSQGVAGKYVADPSAGNPLRFYMPAQYIPAHLGKRLFVSYQVTPVGESTYPSKPFDLEIKDLPGTIWRPIQITSPPGASNSRVSLAAVTDVVGMRLTKWTYMDQGQRVRIIAKGMLKSGSEGREDLRVGDDERVTAAEYNEGMLNVSLPRTFLQTLQLDIKFHVTVEISFDDGFSYKTVPQISPQLIE